MSDEITELKTQLAAALARLAALEARGNGGFGLGTSAEASAGKGLRGTAQLAMDRASVPKEITDAMTKAIPTAGVREIVRTAKR